MPRLVGVGAYNAAVWLLILVAAFPLLWMISTSLKPESELFVYPPTFLPAKPTFEHFRRLLFETPFLVYFRNSVLVALGTVALVMVVATLGAYSLARFRYPGRKVISVAILLTYLLPSVVLLLPLYLSLAWLGLVNSLWSLLVAYATFAMPFSIWLLRTFMQAIPVHVEEAALIDGASRFGAFWDVMLPQALPGIISTTIFTFILAWNEYLFALVFISRDGSKTLPPGVITMLTSAYNVEWSLLMAASVMMTLPLVIVFAFMQRYLTQGLGAGAVKG